MTIFVYLSAWYRCISLSKSHLSWHTMLFVIFRPRMPSQMIASVTVRSHCPLVIPTSKTDWMKSSIGLKTAARADKSKSSAMVATAPVNVILIAPKSHSFGRAARRFSWSWTAERENTCFSEAMCCAMSHRQLITMQHLSSWVNTLNMTFEHRYLDHSAKFCFWVHSTKTMFDHASMRRCLVRFHFVIRMM
jgi:hypothetical protein